MLSSFVASVLIDTYRHHGLGISAAKGSSFEMQIFLGTNKTHITSDPSLYTKTSSTKLSRANVVELSKLFDSMVFVLAAQSAMKTTCVLLTKSSGPRKKSAIISLYKRRARRNRQQRLRRRGVEVELVVVIQHGGCSESEQLTHTRHVVQNIRSLSGRRLGDSCEYRIAE